MLPFLSIGKIIFPMYGVCMALGILIASYIAIIRTKKAGEDADSLLIILAFAIGFALIGAKLLYIVISHGLGKAFHQMLAGDFSFLTQGGLVFYGGLIFGIIGALFGAKFARVRLGAYCESVIPCIPLGHAFGRLGCFFAGCCYGMPYEGPFCLSFPKAGISYPTFPVQLLEALLNIAAFVYLIHYTRKRRPELHALFHYLQIYSVCRFVLEFFRGDVIRGLAMGISTSQWISVGLFIVSTSLMLIKPVKPTGQPV